MAEENEPITGPAEDTRLLKMVGRGDRAAFAQFYDRFSGVLFATAFSVLNNHEAAEDVLQDAFLLIWEKAPLYDPERGKPLTWALTLTRNKAIDRLRSTQRQCRLYDEAQREWNVDERCNDHDSLAAVLTAERGVQVRKAMAQLSAEQRQAIEMTFFGSMTQSEAAEALDEPLGTIKARIRRGLTKLREVLEEQG